MDSVDSISASLTWIDEDFVPEILKRLPIKSVGRFQCVSKSWKSLLSSALFINLHYSFNSSTTPANLKPYIRRKLNYYALCRPQEDYLLHEVIFPFRLLQKASGYHRFDFVDLIHGVVCLSYPVKTHNDSTILWNPAIHKYIALPCQPFLSPDLNFEYFVGFGYSSSKNDFMVLRLRVNFDSLLGPVILPAYEVCFAREGLWKVKIADNIKNFKLYSIYSCSVNGIVHRLVSNHDNSRHCMLIFDCDGEKFRTMELPEELSQVDSEATDMELLEYAGMLSVLVYHGYVKGEMWVMEKHGVATTWKRLYRIREEFDANSGWRLPICSVIGINQSSYEKLAPYGPNEIEQRWSCNMFSFHVYDESMSLMDHPKLQSYTEKEIVQIDLSI